MTYYIFLKSLRILEEFRKNPHVKIPPKSPCANFQSLGKFKNPFLIQKFFFFTFGPADHAAHSAIGPAGPAGPSPLTGRIQPCGPASPRVNGVFVEVRFPFWFAPSELAASLSSLYHVGPGCQFCLPPPPVDRCHFLSSPPATPRCPTSDLEMPGEVFTPCLDSPP
jgi:hypothetical protein